MFATQTSSFTRQDDDFIYAAVLRTHRVRDGGEENEGEGEHQSEHEQK